MNSKSDEIDPEVPPRAMTFQGWLGVAGWMAVGLLLESLMAYKTPSYLDDIQRRELFRLAHAHGTLLHLLLVVIGLSCSRGGLDLQRIPRIALRSGALVMPAGFFLAGLWHPEGDPGLFIWLVPAGAAMLIFGMFAIVLASYRDRKANSRKR